MAAKKTIIVASVTLSLVLNCCKNKRQCNVNISDKDTIVAIYNRGMFEKVLPLALEYNKMHPNDTTVLLVLGGCYYEMGDYEKAKNEYSLAVTYNYISQSDYFGVLADIARKSNDYKSAFAYYDSVLAYNPDDHEILLSKAIAYREIGLNQEAIDICRKLIQLDSSFTTKALINIGYTYMNTQFLDSAYFYFTEASKREPSSIVYFNIAGYYYKLSAIDSALVYYEKAIEYSPNNPFYIFQRGNVYSNIEQMERACDDWKRAAELGYSKAQASVEKYCQ